VLRNEAEPGEGAPVRQNVPALLPTIARTGDALGLKHKVPGAHLKDSLNHIPRIPKHFKIGKAQYRKPFGLHKGLANGVLIPSQLMRISIQFDD
jgi:hypothetical protein